MIDKAIKGLYIKSDLVDDFRSHFYLIILEYDNQELNDKINKGYLLWWCLNVLKNQSGNKSSFFTIYRNKGNYNKGSIINFVEITDWNSNINEELNDYVETLNEIGEYLEKNVYMKLKPEWYINLMLHIKEGLTLREISARTDINYQAILRYTRKSEKEIIKHLPNELKEKYIKFIYKKKNIKYVDDKPYDY